MPQQVHLWEEWRCSGQTVGATASEICQAAAPAFQRRPWSDTVDSDVAEQVGGL